MAGKYTLFSLMGAEPEAKLKNILAKVDIDYQQHFPKGVQSESKEAVIANILNSMRDSRKLILFKTLMSSNFALDQNVIKEQNIEINIEQIRIISLIVKKTINALIEDAIHEYEKEEHFKHVRIIMHDMRHRYEIEKDERLRIIYENEIQRILMDEELQRNLQQLNNHYQERIKEHDEKINHKNTLITDIRKRKKDTLDEASSQIGQELADRTVDNSHIKVYGDVIPENKRDIFMRDFALECYRAEKSELKKYMTVDDIDQDKIHKSSPQRSDENKLKVPNFMNYELARGKGKPIRELAKKEPDFMEIYLKVAAKNGISLDQLTPEQIEIEANLLAEKFNPTVVKMIDGKKEKIVLHAECKKIEIEKQMEKNKLNRLYAKLDLPPKSEFKKSPAALDFDDFLATVDIPPKAAKATRG